MDKIRLNGRFTLSHRNFPPSTPDLPWSAQFADSGATRLDSDYDIDLAELAREIRAAEARGAALLAEFGLEGWKVVVVHEDDDLGDDDDIRGSYGRCYLDEKLIWINGRYAGSPELVEDILRHEIAHALLGGGAEHGPEFQEMAARCGCMPAAGRGEIYASWQRD